MLFDGCEVLGRSEELTAQGDHLFRSLWGTEPFTMGDNVPDPSLIRRNLIGRSRCGVFFQVSPELAVFAVFVDDHGLLIHFIGAKIAIFQRIHNRILFPRSRVCLLQGEEEKKELL